MCSSPQHLLCVTAWCSCGGKAVFLFESSCRLHQNIFPHSELLRAKAQAPCCKALESVPVVSFTADVSLWLLLGQRARLPPLSEGRPDLVPEWDSELNGELQPRDVTCGSKKVVHWRCLKCGHSYSRAVIYRARKGRGCPRCTGEKARADNMLATRKPALALEWHPDRNGDLTPADVTSGSHRKVWWVCSTCSHERQPTIDKRAGSGTGCPVCAKAPGKSYTRHGTLAQERPDLAAEWDHAENGDRTPEDTTLGSNYNAAWQCSQCPASQEHKWRAIVESRALDRSGCPYCTHKKPCKCNSLAAKFPEVAKQLHPTANGTLTADQLTAVSTRKVYWVCSCCAAHVWRAAVQVRTAQGAGCPFCAGQRPCEPNSLATLQPGVTALWDHQHNGSLSPERVTASSDERVFFIGQEDACSVADFVRDWQRQERMRQV